VMNIHFFGALQRIMSFSWQIQTIWMHQVYSPNSNVKEFYLILQNLGRNYSQIKWDAMQLFMT
jgi:hypothetical protein